MFIHLLPFEWFDGSGSLPLVGWKPPSGGLPGSLDLRTREQRATAGGTPGHALVALQSRRDVPDGLFLGRGLDAVLSARQRADAQALLGLGELPSANLRQFMGHLFTLYSDPFGVDSRKPLRANRRRRVRLTFSGHEILNQPFRGAHVTRSVAIFRRDYVQAVASIPTRLDRRDAARRRRGLPDLTAEQRAVLARMYRVEIAKWAGNETRRHFGKLTTENGRALLPDGFKDDGVLKPTTVNIELWPVTDTSDLSGQDLDWEEDGDWATDEDPIGGGAGGPHFTSVKLDTASAYHYLRCTTPVSSDDMYHESFQSYFAAPDDNKLPGTGIRVHATDDTGVYLTRFVESGGTKIYTIQRETSTNTFDAGYASTNPGHSDDANDNRYTLRLEGDGSAYSAYLNGVAVYEGVTDTSISGNVLGGLLGYDNVTRAFGWQNHEIGDLTVYELLRWTETVSADGNVDTTGAGTEWEALSDDDPDSYVEVT